MINTTIRTCSKTSLCYRLNNRRDHKQLRLQKVNKMRKDGSIGTIICTNAESQVDRKQIQNEDRQLILTALCYFTYTHEVNKNENLHLVLRATLGSIPDSVSSKGIRNSNSKLFRPNCVLPSTLLLLVLQLLNKRYYYYYYYYYCCCCYYCSCCYEYI